MSKFKRWQCGRCGELMTEQEVQENTYCCDYGDRHQPPEYASTCANPRCNGSHEDQEEVWLCEADRCDQVATEDDLCATHWAILENEGTIDPGGDTDMAEYMMGDR